MRFFLILFSLLNAQIAFSESAPPPITTVASVDLNQYSETGHGVAAIPQMIENDNLLLYVFFGSHDGN